MFRYYLDVTKFALAFSILCIPFLGFITGILVFGLAGTPIGLIGYSQFHKTEYYTYFNLGFTRRKLIISTWVFNILAMIPLFLIYLLGNFLFKMIYHE
tara:strand:- start:1348 stop:1641 length:294 start_codon:yes stop_codon:yes gene_type:complete